MAADLNSLIQRLKEEGIEEARDRSREIIDNTTKKAAKIIQEAEEKKAEIIKGAEEKAANLKRSCDDALKQASRDLILSLRENIIELFNSVIKREVSASLTKDVMKDVITRVAEGFKKGSEPDIEVVLSPEDKKGLEESLLKALKKELKKGVTFKPSHSVKKGFRIGAEDKEFYYDFTDDAIAEAIELYLSPRIKDIIKIKD